MSFATPIVGSQIVNRKSLTSQCTLLMSTATSNTARLTCSSKCQPADWHSDENTDHHHDKAQPPRVVDRGEESEECTEAYDGEEDEFSHSLILSLCDVNCNPKLFSLSPFHSTFVRWDWKLCSGSGLGRLRLGARCLPNSSHWPPRDPDRLNGRSWMCSRTQARKQAKVGRTTAVYFGVTELSSRRRQITDCGPGTISSY